MGAYHVVHPVLVTVEMSKHMQSVPTRICVHAATRPVLIVTYCCIGLHWIPLYIAVHVHVHLVVVAHVNPLVVAHVDLLVALGLYAAVVLVVLLPVVDVIHYVLLKRTRPSPPHVPGTTSAAVDASATALTRLTYLAAAMNACAAPTASYRPSDAMSRSTDILFVCAVSGQATGFQPLFICVHE